MSTRIDSKFLKTNRDKLAKISVIGEVVSPVVGSSSYKVSANGEPVFSPASAASLIIFV